MRAQRQSYPWIVRSTALVNQYYIYALDRDFGPFFLKSSSYFPYNARLCLKGHEYAKRQLAQRGVAYEALDNGLMACADPAQLQAICDDLAPQLRHIPEIVVFDSVAGETDAMLEVTADSMTRLQAIRTEIAALEDVVQIETSIILKRHFNRR